MPIPEQLLRIEKWRALLIDEGLEGIEQFLLEYPDADKKLLKPMVQKAQTMNHRHGTPRFLLRYIRELDDQKEKGEK
jgi:ribosomal 50S subunit-associated protein YjgA (DUF615 family)